jgi:hypothetical protein
VLVGLRKYPANFGLCSCTTKVSSGGSTREQRVKISFIWSFTSLLEGASHIASGNRRNQTSCAHSSLPGQNMQLNRKMCNKIENPGIWVFAYAISIWYRSLHSAFMRLLERSGVKSPMRGRQMTVSTPFDIRNQAQLRGPPFGGTPSHVSISGRIISMTRDTSAGSISMLLLWGPGPTDSMSGANWSFCASMPTMVPKQRTLINKNPNA